MNYEAGKKYLLEWKKDLDLEIEDANKKVSFVGLNSILLGLLDTLGKGEECECPNSTRVIYRESDIVCYSCGKSLPEKPKEPEPPEHIEKVNLNGEFDASVWAKEFIEKTSHYQPNTKDHVPVYIDEDVMLGWFANAIMAGYDYARRERPKEPEFCECGTSPMSGAIVCPRCGNKIKPNKSKESEYCKCDVEREVMGFIEGIKCLICKLPIQQPIKPEKPKREYKVGDVAGGNEPECMLLGTNKWVTFCDGGLWDRHKYSNYFGNLLDGTYDPKKGEKI